MNLFNKRTHQKIDWNLGAGRNGKDTWTTTITEILGTTNCTAISLIDLSAENRFKNRPLATSLVNICPEATKGDPTELKTLTGGGMITTDIKGKNETMSFICQTDFYLSSNEMPTITDTSNGLWSRFFFIPWKKDYSKIAIDNFHERWTKNPEERSGILNLMLQGARQYFTQNEKFTISEEMADLTKEIQQDADPYRIWEQEQKIYNDNSFTPTDQTWESFCEYCKRNYLTIISEQVFYKRLRKDKKIRYGQKTVHGIKGVHGYYGLEIKPLPSLINLDEQQTTLTPPTDKPQKEALYTPIPPDEPCHKCSNYTSEYTIQTETTKRKLCPDCFKQMQTDYTEYNFKITDKL